MKDSILNTDNNYPLSNIPNAPAYELLEGIIADLEAGNGLNLDSLQTLSLWNVINTNQLNQIAEFIMADEVAGLQYLEDLKLQIWGDNLYAETTLRWTYDADPATIQDFQIFRSAEGSAIMPYKTLPAADLAEFSFVDQDVKSKRRYFYQIMARHVDGGFSGRSEVLMVKIP